MPATQYAALLRGISPLNPNMRNEHLRRVFVGLGFAKVKTVISSGNVLFESPRTDAKTLEAEIEAAIIKQLGFTSTTILRSRTQLQRLANAKPFGEAAHSDKSYLTVTFVKRSPRAKLDTFDGPGYSVIKIYKQEVCSVVDLGNAKAPQLMTRLEKQLGKDITTRTWKTVLRILAAFDKP